MKLKPFATMNGAWLPDIRSGCLVFTPKGGKLGLVDICELNVAVGLKAWVIPPFIRIERK